MGLFLYSAQTMCHCSVVREHPTVAAPEAHHTLRHNHLVPFHCAVFRESLAAPVPQALHRFHRLSRTGWVGRTDLVLPQMIPEDTLPAFPANHSCSLTRRTDWSAQHKDCSEGCLAGRRDCLSRYSAGHMGSKEAHSAVRRGFHVGHPHCCCLPRSERTRWRSRRGFRRSWPAVGSGVIQSAWFGMAHGLMHSSLSSETI